MNIDEELLAAIDEYRFDKRLDTRSLAIEELLRAAIERHTKKPGTRKKGE